MFARAVGSGASNELRLGRTDHVVSVGETVLMKPHHPGTPLYIAQIATMFDCRSGLRVHVILYGRIVWPECEGGEVERLRFC